MVASISLPELPVGILSVIFKYMDALSLKYLVGGKWGSLPSKARELAVEQCAQELSLLPYVHTLVLYGSTPLWTSNGFDLYRKILEKIPGLKEVYLDWQHGNYLESRTFQALPLGLTKISSLQHATSSKMEKWLQSNMATLESLDLHVGELF
ncbi:16145_t:CDS:2 [Acaulospora colombiana]|uniref:16145_t:CDS:1 n=1 Tax=Acaulospora colombiana TaxID=27376 RepID=A0ACA9NYM0_9GLOM|nr:16145_t:CDS:2 [Acaulospora colombiana]